MLYNFESFSGLLPEDNMLFKGRANSWRSESRSVECGVACMTHQGPARAGRRRPAVRDYVTA